MYLEAITDGCEEVWVYGAGWQNDTRIRYEYKRGEDTLS